MQFISRLLEWAGLRRPAPEPPTFTFMGRVYDARYWEKVPDPSDAFPPPGFKQDMMVRRKTRSS